MNRKLDAGIAKALGHEMFGNGTYVRKNGKMFDVPRYSKDYTVMGELIEELHERGFSINHIDSYEGQYTVIFAKDGFIFSGRAGTMPKAAALAAHVALTGEKWEEQKEPNVEKLISTCKCRPKLTLISNITNEEYAENKLSDLSSSIDKANAKEYLLKAMDYYKDFKWWLSDAPEVRAYYQYYEGANIVPTPSYRQYMSVLLSREVHKDVIGDMRYCVHNDKLLQEVELAWKKYLCCLNTSLVECMEKDWCPRGYQINNSTTKTLKERAKEANKVKPEFLIDIHGINLSPEEAKEFKENWYVKRDSRFTAVLYEGHSQRSKDTKLAKNIMEVIAGKLTVAEFYELYSTLKDHYDVCMEIMENAKVVVRGEEGV